MIVKLTELHSNQQKVIDGHERFTVLSCGRRWGKSALAANLMSETAINGEYGAYFTPTYKLLNEQFRVILRALQPVIRIKNETEKRIETITGGVLDFWSLSNPDSGRGRKYHRAVIDEAAFVRDLGDAWSNAIRPTLTDFKGDAWFLSTPKGKNDFHTLWMRGRAGEAGWKSWQMATYDNPFIDPSEIDSAKRDLPALAFSQEYLAEFNENVANPFGRTFIDQCTYPISNQPAVCFGVDLAKSFDWSVIIGLDRNAQVCYFDRWQGDWRTTTQKILNLPNVPIAIDSTGVGDPIGEDVARVKDVELFKFTSNSKQQLMEGLAAAIQQRKISFPAGPITDELSNFEYEYTRTGVKYSAPKGLHDDCVCALALAWHKHKTAGTGEYNFAFI